jgi:excinuclease ABC subunit C
MSNSEGEKKGNFAGGAHAGAALIRLEIAGLPDTPGVYRMISAADEVLYVGKAKSLKKRVASYVHIERLSARIVRMIAQTARMEFVHTRTEVEALLLEANLIKKLKPRYNILLRDDKSFPSILIAQDHDFPQVVKHRGAKTRKGRYFGPFASAGNVNQALYVLQRAFMLRTCSDHVFAHRTRPCLQYHIKRCTAPCVGLVDQNAYQKQVDQAAQFLSGKTQAIQSELSQAMLEASAAMQYEEAARIRDRLRALTAMQIHQDIHIEGLQDADVFGAVAEGGQICIQVYFFRAGANYGGYAYYPRHSREETIAAVLGAFLAQFYQSKPIPKDIILSHVPEDLALLEEALQDKSETKVSLSVPKRGDRLKLVAFAQRNAAQALERHVAQGLREAVLLEGVARVFVLEEPPERIEIYDNSHISGAHMVGAMVVAGREGFQKNAYRKFNIKLAGAGDDYAMMREVMERRFARALADSEGFADENWPDLVLIDGGAGQLGACKGVLEDLGIADRVALVAIAKGPDRHAGREMFFMEGREPFQLSGDDPVLHYLQRLRDEAHRFAVSAHRARRAQQVKASPLDEVAGIGAKRKKALLLYFGSAKDIAAANVEDLQKVEGVSRALAEKIYSHFH